MANDGCRLAAVERQGFEQAPERIDVMPIDIDSGEIKCAPFIEEGLHVEHDLGRSVGLNFIVIDDGSEAGKLVLSGAKRRLPNRTLVGLTVPHDAEHAVFLAPHPGRKRHSDCDRKSVPERSGRGLDAGDLSALRVAAKDRVTLAEGGQYRFG